MAKIRTQADRRNSVVITDQHGRKFAVWVEKDTMHPCSALVPRGWNPPMLAGQTPFLPPEEYVSFPADEPFAMRIDYDRWIAFVEQMHKMYDEKISSSAVLLFGSGAAQAIESKNVELMRYVGPPPTSVQPIKAARAGNKFVLGLTDKMPEWAIPFFSAPVVAEEVFPDVFEDEEEDEVAPDPTAADEGFEDATEDEDKYQELEEEIDPAAIGGKKRDPRPAAKRKGANRKTAGVE